MQQNDIALLRRQRMNGLFEAQSIKAFGFTIPISKVIQPVDINHRQAVLMAPVVDVEVAHDRIKPAAEIFALPLALAFKCTCKRILQKVLTVCCRTRKR